MNTEDERWNAVKGKGNMSLPEKLRAYSLCIDVMEDGKNDVVYFLLRDAANLIDAHNDELVDNGNPWRAAHRLMKLDRNECFNTLCRTMAHLLRIDVDYVQRERAAIIEMDTILDDGQLRAGTIRVPRER